MYLLALWLDERDCPEINGYNRGRGNRRWVLLIPARVVGLTVDAALRHEATGLCVFNKLFWFYGFFYPFC